MTDNDENEITNDVFGEDRERGDSLAFPDGQVENHQEGQSSEPEPDRVGDGEKKEHYIPKSRLDQELQRRQALEQELEARDAHYQALVRQMQQNQQQQQHYRQPPQPQQQQQQQEIDPFLDPGAYAQHLVNQERQQFSQAFNQLETRRLSDALDMSERFARSEYGDDVVNAAFQLAQQSGILPQFVNQRDPYGTLVNWFNREMVYAEMGQDPQAYRNKVREEVLAEINKGGISEGGQSFPTSLADATAAGGTHSGNEQSIESVFATDRKRGA